MKKLSKLDVFLFVCICVACFLAMTTWIVELIVGIKVLWISLLSEFVTSFIITVGAAMYFLNVIEKIIEYIKERRIRRNKNE